MKRIGLVALFICFLVPCLQGAEDIAYTIRTPDGVVLVLATPEAAKEAKEIVEKWEKDLTATEVRDRLQAAKVPGIRDVSIFLTPVARQYLEWDKRPLQSETLTLKEAERRGILPYIEGQPLYEARKILEIDGFQVILPSHAIGTTGVFPPVDIVVRSAGKYVGDYAHIWVAGMDVIDYGPHIDNRGFNIAVIDPSTGKVARKAFFNTTATETQSIEMARFIASIPNDHIVAVAGRDDVSRKLTPEGVAALRSLGSTLDLRRHYRLSYALIGIKGARPGQAAERVAGEPVQLTAFPRAETNPARITTLDRPKCLLLTGTEPEATIHFLCYQNAIP